MNQCHFAGKMYRAVNPPHLQILRSDSEGMIDDIISPGIRRHLCKKHSLTRSSGICDVSHHCIHTCKGIIYHTKVHEDTFDVNSKIAQTTQSLLSESQ